MKLTSLEKLAMNNPARVWLQRRFEAPNLFSGVSLATGATCLEIGCGRGVGVLLINQRFNCQRVVAVDLDKDLMSQAKRYIACPPKWAKGVNSKAPVLIVADASSMPFVDGSFDAVFAFGVLHHISGWRKVIGEVRRVLKPGGVFSFEEILWPDSPLFFNKLWGHTPISESDLLEEARGIGLDILQYRKIRWLPSICTAQLAKRP